MKGSSMTLTKDDLQEIKLVVKDVVTPIVEASEERLATAMAEDLAVVNQRFDQLETDVAELKDDMREVRWHLAEFHDVRQ